MTHPLNAAAARLERIEALDLPAEKIARVVRALPPPAKAVLSGGWLGHALHPLLTDIPVGAFTSAIVLDLLGHDDGADALVAVGIASTPAVFASGWSDWGDEELASTAIRRSGIVHAVLNGTAVAVMGASLAARRSGDRGRGKLLALGAMGLMGGAGWLGGHLTYTKASRVEPD